MAQMLIAPSVVETADRTIGFRRRIGAVALPLAFACQLVCNALYAVASTGNAGDSGSAAESLRFYADHADEMLVATVFALVGSLLAIPGLLAALKVLRPTRPMLALWAVVLMIAGYTCYFGAVFTNFDEIALATSRVDAGAALDASGAAHAALPFGLLFVVGNLLGTLLLGLAVVLSRALPWWAGGLIMGWTAGHVVNIVGGGEWFAVAGGALEIAGLCVIAAHALRTPDSAWAARG